MEEVADIVSRASHRGERVKVAGSGHSFTDAACTDGHLVRLTNMTRVLAVDPDLRTAIVEAGITIADLAERLSEHGLALPSLGDIGYQTVAGAIATGTHGTGSEFRGIASQVRALQMVCADGRVLECAAGGDDETFNAARVGLGALGVVTAVTLQCEPAFMLHAVEEPMRLPEVLERFHEISAENEHVEFYWFPHTDRAILKRNTRTTAAGRPRAGVRAWFDDVLVANRAFGLACRIGRARPAWIPRIAGVVGRALSRRTYTDRSDRVFTSPRLVRFTEMEYALPREALRDAVTGVRDTIERGGHLVSFPVEVRVGAAEDALLALAHGRETCYVAVHMFWGMPYEPLFHDVEKVFESLDGRPHWGKVHFRDAASLAAVYAHWDRFAAVRKRLDPAGLFRNAYLDRVLGAP